MRELTEIIYREIAAQGVISFARFMELSLYCPRLGYYESQSKQIGCQGDFYTNVSVGSLFGELLALRFSQWLAELSSRQEVPAPGSMGDCEKSIQADKPPSASFQLVEAGAHDGQLASDILTWIERFEPAWFNRLEYWILEPSLERQHWQQEKLAGFPAQLRWFSSWESFAAREIQGIIFSNELLDAFPVHRIGWDAKVKGWFQWGVGWEADHFVWKRMSLERTGLTIKDEYSITFPQLSNELLEVLPDGFTTEVSPAAQRWWQQAARALGHGKLLTLDYGLGFDDFFVPERASGTLRSYRRHH